MPIQALRWVTTFRNGAEASLFINVGHLSADDRSELLEWLSFVSRCIERRIYATPEEPQSADAVDPVSRVTTG